MKIPALGGSGEGYAVLLGVGAVVFVGLFLFLKSQAKAAAAALADVNQGTPYEGTGVVGTLGNAANQVSGGWLADQGTQLGGWLYEFLNPSAAATTTTNAAPATLQTRKQAISDNYWDDAGGALTP
jgi:hypothetical protein